MSVHAAGASLLGLLLLPVCVQVSLNPSGVLCLVPMYGHQGQLLASPLLMIQSLSPLKTLGQLDRKWGFSGERRNIVAQPLFPFSKQAFSCQPEDTLALLAPNA